MKRSNPCTKLVKFLTMFGLIANRSTMAACISSSLPPLPSTIPWPQSQLWSDPELHLPSEVAHDMKGIMIEMLRCYTLDQVPDTRHFPPHIKIATNGMILDFKQQVAYSMEKDPHTTLLHYSTAKPLEKETIEYELMAQKTFSAS